MKIGIIGGGAIGLLTASLLDSEKHRITIYTKRKQQKKELIKKQLHLQPDGVIFPVYAKHIEELGEEEIFLVCVKQHQLPDLVPILKQGRVPLIFFQNGMGHLDILSGLAESAPIFVGVVEHGAIRTKDYIVSQTGNGKVRIAPYNDQAESASDLVEMLINEKYPVSFEGDWHKMLTDKLVINAVINPLTALFDVNNGEILSNPSLRVLAEHLTEEVCEALNLEADMQWARVQRIILSTAANMSSMWVDMSKNQPTEIEGITGYLLSRT